MKNLLIRSYAKINICLDVLDKREDGYHNLDMIMVPVEMHDSILLSELKNVEDNFVTIDDFSVAPIQYNLATFSIDALAAKYKFDNKFRVLIHKVIPMQAGLGGGSSNAATTMKGVCKYLKIKATTEDLVSLSKKIGSDIPFFITNTPARCRGVGDIIEPIKIKNNYYVLIVKPEAGCSTKDIYAMYKPSKTKHASVDDVQKALEEGDDDLLEKSMFNVLQDAAIQTVPEIKIIIDKLREFGLTMVQVTGSGSAVFALSKDKRLLNKIAKKLDYDYFVEVTRIIK